VNAGMIDVAKSLSPTAEMGSVQRGGGKLCTYARSLGFNLYGFREEILFKREQKRSSRT
jgi:hypothetical protein